MELANWIGKCYSIYTGKSKALLCKPTNLTPKPFYINPIVPIQTNFPKHKIYGLSEFIVNEAKTKAKRKTLLDLLEDEKTQVNKQIKWEDVVGVGIVGLGLWALYTYSGYKISLVPPQLKF